MSEQFTIRSAVTGDIDQIVNMRKSILLIGFLLLLNACAEVEKLKPRDFTEWINFNESISEFHSAKAISEYMLQNLHYTSGFERIESRKYGYNWKYPKETFVDKYGFCYDLAAFSLYALLKNGYPDSKLLFVCWGDWGNKSNTGHFVSVFKENDLLYIIDNGRYQGPFTTSESVIQVAARHRKVLHYRFIKYDEIPFHIKYTDMDYFCSDHEIN